MSTPTTAASFDAYEVAFRIPGQSWKRRTIRSEAQEQKFYDMVDDEGAEVRWAEQG